MVSLHSQQRPQMSSIQLSMVLCGLAAFSPESSAFDWLIFIQVHSGMASDGNQPGSLSSAWILGVARHLSRSICCQCDNSWFDCHLSRYRNWEHMETWAIGKSLTAERCSPNNATRLCLCFWLSAQYHRERDLRLTVTMGGYADWERYSTIWITWWLGDAVALIVRRLSFSGYRTMRSTGVARSCWK